MIRGGGGLGGGVRIARPFLGDPGAATCAGELNGDGSVYGSDLAVLIRLCGGAGSADLTGNGVVDALDLGTLLGAWGPCGVD